MDINADKLKGATAGAVAGILLVLALALVIFGQAEDQFVTRREYAVTLASIDQRLADLKSNVREISACDCDEGHAHQSTTPRTAPRRRRR